MATMITDSKSLKETVKKYVELKDQIDELTAQLEVLKKDIQECMGENEELIIDEYTVKWTRFVQNRFDQSAFKTLHPKLYENFKTASESRRFGITEDKHYQGKEV